jgi:ribonuclease R
LIYARIAYKPMTYDELVSHFALRIARDLAFEELLIALEQDED